MSLQIHEQWAEERIRRLVDLAQQQTQEAAERSTPAFHGDILTMG